MAKTREQKAAVISTLESSLKDAASAVFVHFRGINVAQESKMRRDFRGEGVKYTVAKKTLLRRALASLGHEHESLPLEGELAIAYNMGDADATAPARKIAAFAKEFGIEKLTIAGGLFQGALLDARGMNEIATIPPVPVLRGMFANVLNSPLQRFAVVLNQVAETKSA